MTVFENLIRARGVISIPERWTQGHFARYACGAGTSPTSQFASCFCALGAVERVMGCRAYRSKEVELLAESVGDKEQLPSDDNLRGNAVFNLVHTFNDNHSHEDVLSMFDRAISLAQERNL